MLKIDSITSHLLVIRRQSIVMSRLAGYRWENTPSVSECCR